MTSDFLSPSSFEITLFAQFWDFLELFRDVHCAFARSVSKYLLCKRSYVLLQVEMGRVHAGSATSEEPAVSKWGLRGRVRKGRCKSYPGWRFGAFPQKFRNLSLKSVNFCAFKEIPLVALILRYAYPSRQVRGSYPLFFRSFAPEQQNPRNIRPVTETAFSEPQQRHKNYQ